MDKNNILVVEDNPMNQLLIKTIFENEGFNFIISNNGLEAINTLKEKSFNLILMDLMMPVMNGYEASSIIRNELNLDIPIIAITADVTSKIKDKCIQAGMNDYISKPYKIEELILITRKHLNNITNE